MGNGRNTKITQEDLPIEPKQQIVRFHIPMNEPLAMRILQCFCYLLHVGDHCRQRNHLSLGMPLPQGAMGGVVHHQEGHAFLHVKIKNTHNMWMDESCDDLRLSSKVLDIFLHHPGM